MTTTVELIIEGFPVSTTPKVDREPTCKTIKEIKKCIITNASLIESEVGGGYRSLLGLVMSSARHTTIIGHNFIRHANLGVLLICP